MPVLPCKVGVPGAPLCPNFSSLLLLNYSKVSLQETTLWMKRNIVYIVYSHSMSRGLFTSARKHLHEVCHTLGSVDLLANRASLPPYT
jgi:hypothetical protein